MKKEKEDIYRKLTEIAKKIEEFGLGCIVTDNPFRVESKGDVGHCLIVTQPISGKEFSESEFSSLFKEAEYCCKNMIKNDALLLDLGPIMLVDSLEKWFNYLDGQKKHPILLGFPYGSTDVFLSTVIYGQELHEKIIRAFQNKYGENFIQECFEVWEKDCKRRGRDLDVFYAEFRKEIKERKKPLSTYETKEISDFLLECLELSVKNKISAIVGIDRSGRPLAQMLYELLRKNGYEPLPVVDFLDPHQLKEEIIWESVDKLRIPDIFAEQFKKEFPAIFQLLQIDPRKVLFIDDQVFSHFNTINAVRQLVSQAIQKESFDFSFLVVSGFNGYNGLTWWKDKKLLRIGSNKKCRKITLRSVPRKISPKEEKRINNFETKLSEITEGVFNLWKLQRENYPAAR